MISKMWNVLSFTKRGTIPVSAESKVNDGKRVQKVRKIDNFVPKNDSEAKSVRQFRIRYSDIEDRRPDMRHWIISSNLGQIRLVVVMRVTWCEFLLILVQIVTLSVGNFIPRF